MGYKILVVDDEKDVVESYQKRLTEEGYEVVIAYDGYEALVKVNEQNPDIILLDLMLPQLNGFDVLKEVKQKYATKWVPVIIISAKSELESVKKCYNLEADHYLSKPCTMDKVLKGVEIMVSLIPLRRER